jgi:hypothetical protein
MLCVHFPTCLSRALHSLHYENHISSNSGRKLNYSENFQCSCPNMTLLRSPSGVSGLGTRSPWFVLYKQGFTSYGTSAQRENWGPFAYFCLICVLGTKCVFFSSLQLSLAIYFAPINTEKVSPTCPLLLSDFPILTTSGMCSHFRKISKYQIS